jgi:hypothetical protein
MTTKETILNTIKRLKADCEMLQKEADFYTAAKRTNMAMEVFLKMENAKGRIECLEWVIHLMTMNEVFPAEGERG